VSAGRTSIIKSRCYHRTNYICTEGRYGPTLWLVQVLYGASSTVHYSPGTAPYSYCTMDGDVLLYYCVAEAWHRSFLDAETGFMLLSWWCPFKIPLKKEKRTKTNYTYRIGRRMDDEEIETYVDSWSSRYYGKKVAPVGTLYSSIVYRHDFLSIPTWSAVFIPASILRLFLYISIFFGLYQTNYST